VSRKHKNNFDIVSNISAGLTQVYLIIIIIIYYKNLIDWFPSIRISFSSATAALWPWCIKYDTKKQNVYF